MQTRTKLFFGEKYSNKKLEAGNTKKNLVLANQSIAG